MIPLRVSDLKQYIYCPRIPYFYYVLPIPRRITRKMEYGALEHIEIERMEKDEDLSLMVCWKGNEPFMLNLNLRGLVCTVF